MKDIAELFRKTGRGLLTSVVLIFMLLTYAAGAAVVFFGFGYADAVYKNGFSSQPDISYTPAFADETLRILDGLYAAVTDRDISPPETDGVIYFAFGLNLNRVFCSDPKVLDVPTFEEKYMSGDSYVYALRFAAGEYKVVNRLSGSESTLELSPPDAAATLFNGELRDYEDAILIIVLPRERIGFSGYGLASLQLYMSKNAVSFLFVALGVLFVAASVLLSARSAVKRLEKIMARTVRWIYFEIKLALLVAVYWWLIKDFTLPPTYDKLLYILAVVLPVTYILGISVRFGKKEFFAQSLVRDISGAVRRFFDSVLPVLPMQIKLRQRMAAFAVFGLLLPAAVLILGDLLLGYSALRVLMIVYIVYFTALFVLFARHYAKLVNGVSEIVRLSGLLSLGDRVPDLMLDEREDLYPLACTLTDVSGAAAAAADRMFVATNKKLEEIGRQTAELSSQIDVLEKLAINNEEAQTLLRRLRDSAAEISNILNETSPVGVPVLKRIDLLELLDDAVNSHLAALSAARLSIQAHIPDPPAYITADAGQIRALLNKLFENLAMYTKAGTVVDLYIRSVGGFWRFDMMNTISPERGGTGAAAAGLTLAREYVIINGGRIEYKTEGDRFTVSFALPAAH